MVELNEQICWIVREVNKRGRRINKDKMTRQLIANGNKKSDIDKALKELMYSGKITDNEGLIIN